eukprot:scaffold14909_cov107-Isochrysis_galbana.AAC.2
MEARRPCHRRQQWPRQQSPASARRGRGALVAYSPGMRDGQTSCAARHASHSSIGVAPVPSSSSNAALCGLPKTCTSRRG